jgi:hypothetical protein
MPNNSLDLSKNANYRIINEHRFSSSQGLDQDVYDRLRPKTDVEHDWTVLILQWSSFTVFSFMYGGLHLLAWNAAFPTKVQRDLWRISAITIVAFPLYIAPRVWWSIWRKFSLARGTYPPKNMEMSFGSVGWPIYL